MNEIKKLYEFADEKFETNKRYRKNKTRQDFIKMMKKHFDYNITTNKQVKYDNQMVEVNDLINGWETIIETYNDRVNLNSLANIKSALVIVSSIFASVFIGSQKVSYADANFAILFIVGLMLAVGMYLVFMLIDWIERYIGRNFIYEKTFNSMCIKILKDYI